MTIYMKVNDIKGNVGSKGHEHWIELTSFEHAVSCKVKTDAGQVTDRVRSGATLSDFIVTKSMDKASPQLYSAALDSIDQGNVIIDVCHAGNDKRYLRYTLSNGIFSQYAISAANVDDSDDVSETLILNFTKIEKTFTPYDARGSASSPETTGYDIEQAKVL